MKLLSSTQKSNLNINKRGENFGTTSSCITKVQAYSEETNHSLHSTIDVLKPSLHDRDYKSVSNDDISRPPPHRDKSTSERADLSLLISLLRDETIRQLNIQNSVLQKQFKSLFTPSLHVALDQVRINSKGVPLSKYPLSERIRDTLAIATLPIGYYDYVLLQLSELTVFRRHTWQRQEYIATAADIPSISSSNYLDDHDLSLQSPGPGSPVPGPEWSLPLVPEIPIMSATYRATCQSTPTTIPTLGGDIGTCGAGPQIPHAGTSHDEPAVDPPDPTPIRPLIEPKEPARSHPSVELTPVLEQHAHLHEVKPCRVSIPSTARGSRKSKKYFYSRSMRVSNLKSPFHLDHKAPHRQNKQLRQSHIFRFLRKSCSKTISLLSPWCKKM